MSPDPVPTGGSEGTGPAPVPPGRSLGRDLVTLAKPGITGLIVLVAVGGYFVADPASIDLLRLGLLALTGASASAGSAMLNHYLDRDVDARMRRTRERPLPDARIDPASAAAVLGTGLLVGGVVAAAIVLNPLTGFSILLGGLTYVVVYTAWLKRRTSWNIVIGGFAGSAPALAGSAAAVGHWTNGAIALAVLVFLWTPPHFWSLALLLREDYAKAGLPMLPKMDDPAYSGKVVVVSAALLLPATALLALVGPLTWPAIAVCVAAGIGFVLATGPLWTTPERRFARRGFLYSGPYLLAILIALVGNFALLSAGLHPPFG